MPVHYVGARNSYITRIRIRGAKSHGRTGGFFPVKVVAGFRGTTSCLANHLRPSAVTLAWHHWSAKTPPVFIVKNHTSVNKKTRLFVSSNCLKRAFKILNTGEVNLRDRNASEKRSASGTPPQVNQLHALFLVSPCAAWTKRLMPWSQALS
jgi:hypothetical protein